MKARRTGVPTFHPGRQRYSPRRHVEEGIAAGCVSIGGPFALAHHDEIIECVRHVEARQHAASPDKKIVAVRAAGERLFIDTNDVLLARAIGETLRRSYQGELQFHFGEPGCLLRVHWER